MGFGDINMLHKKILTVYTVYFLGTYPIRSSSFESWYACRESRKYALGFQPINNNCNNYVYYMVKI